MIPKFSACCLLLVLCPVFAQDAPRRINHAQASALILTRTAAEYPPIAKQLKLEGVVELEVTLGEDASVLQVSIVSGNPVLTKAGTEAVKHWKFAPFKEAGKPVKVIAPISLSFHLGGA